MKKAIVSLIAATLFAACSKTEAPLTPVSYEASDVPINLVADAVNGSTRAPYADITPGTQQDLTARVIGSLTLGVFNSPIPNADGPITFKAMHPDDYTLAGAQTYRKGFTPAAYYPIDPAVEVYLVGLHPATGWSTTGLSKFDFTIDGHSDVMSAPVTMTTKADALASPTTFRRLAFEHELTLLNINVVAASAAAISYWGDVQDISLTHIDGAVPKSTITVDFGMGITNTSFDATTAELPTFISGTDNAFTGQTMALTTTAAPASYVIAPYFTVVAGDNPGKCTLDVKTANGGTVSVPVTINADSAGSTVGKAYEITLTFKATEIMATATVAPWKIGGTGAGTLE